MKHLSEIRKAGIVIAALLLASAAAGCSHESNEEIAGAASVEEMKEFFRTDTENDKEEINAEYAHDKDDYIGYREAYCRLNDAEGLEKELMELKWVAAEKTDITDFYCYGGYDEIRISKSGLMERSGGAESSFYELARKRDVKKLNKILDKYFFIDDYAQIAIKLNENEYNFDNFTADYTYSELFNSVMLSSPDNYNYNISGRIKRDAKSDTTYITGDGIIRRRDSSIEYAARGTECAYSIFDKESGETKWYYMGDNTYGESKDLPKNIYSYVYEELRMDLMNATCVARRNDYDKEKLPFKVSKKKGLTEYNYSIPEILGFMEGITSHRIVLNDSGQLISYEDDISDEHKKHYRLENYEFNSDSFAMEDVTAMIEDFKEKAAGSRN